MGRKIIEVILLVAFVAFVSWLTAKWSAHDERREINSCSQPSLGLCGNNTGNEQPRN